MASQIDELISIIEPRKDEFTPTEAKDMILRKGYSYDIANTVIEKVYGKDAFAKEAKIELKEAKDKGYQHHKISKRTFLIIGIVIIVAVLAILVFSFVFNPLTPAAKECGSDETCFFIEAATCAPVRVTTFSNGITTQREILGISNNECVLSVNVSGNKNINGDMVCSLNAEQLNHYVLHKSFILSDIKEMCSGALVTAMS
ncbi:MAG: hypothetical protein JXA43_01080 [Candidatus Diapherotrites archaeon]|nr:hypothetical protein [Candidatus Diapherotrites archaeon]